MRHPRRLFLLGGVALGLVLPSGAAAQTVVGQSSFTPGTLSCPAAAIIQTQVATGTSYTIPISGVITSWRFHTDATGLPGLALRIARPAGPGRYTLAGSAIAPAVADHSVNIYPLDPGLPVRAGDLLGTFQANGGHCLATALQGATASDVVATDPTTDLFAGVPTALPSGNTAKLPVEAAVEPDRDGDTYGDDTEDTCPDDPGAHTGACPADDGLTQSFSPASVRDGATAVLTARVTNAGAFVAGGSTVFETLPAGLSFAGGAGSGGACTQTGNQISCPLGNLPAHGAAVAQIVVAAAGTGTRAMSGHVSSALDSNGANDAASSSLTVVAPPSVTKTVAAKLCTVPKVVGLSTAAAKKKLAKAGCKLGKATFRGKKAKRGQHVRITAQYVPARIHVARGTKIAVTTRATGRPTPVKQKPKRRG